MSRGGDADVTHESPANPGCGRNSSGGRTGMVAGGQGGSRIWATVGRVASLTAGSVYVVLRVESFLGGADIAAKPRWARRLLELPSSEPLGMPCLEAVRSLESMVKEGALPPWSATFDETLTETGETFARPSTPRRGCPWIR